MDLKKGGNEMSKTSKMIRNLVVGVIALAVAVGVAYYAGRTANEPEVVEVKDSKKGFDIKLPGEVEKRVVTIEEIEGKLEDVVELTTCIDSYTVTRSKDENRYIFEDIKLWGTKNSITLSAQGVVKVGYNLNDFKVQVDDSKIYIAVPKAQINDNHIIGDTVKCSEKNNILNPIEFPQYQELIEEMEAMGLEDAVSRGIYGKADERVKKAIDGFLAEFNDYDIVYM